MWQGKLAVAVLVMSLSVCGGEVYAAGKSYALVVGVETYDPAFFNRLSYAEDDAVEMAAALEKLGFNVTLMTREAEIPARRPNTAKKIADQLAARMRGLAKDDTLVVALSGHGVQYKSPRQLADKSEESQFFCPEEADLADPNSLLPLGRVYKYVQDCPAERKLLIVDACRNEVLSDVGKSAREVVLEPVGVTPRTVPKGTLALFSCTDGEKSFEHPELGHGVFCYHVLQYLRGEADDRYYFRDQPTIRGLADYAARQTRDYVHAKLNQDQLPEMVGRTSDWPIGGGGAPLAKLVTNTIGMKLVLIPAGQFAMGSAESPVQLAAAFETKAEDYEDERPYHTVRITQPFYMGMYEVTLGQFLKFYHDAGYKTTGETDGNGGEGFNGTDFVKGPQYVPWSWGHPSQTNRHPVVNVSWNDADAFCRWLSEKEKKTYRLPTEAEWEYACRAGTTTRYSCGDDPEELAGIGNVLDATCHAQLEYIGHIAASDGYAFTAPVGSYQPNKFGLYDMHGNVFEWCNDWYGGDYYDDSPRDDPQGPETGEYVVFRGSSWASSGNQCRASNRFWGGMAARDTAGGFRVVLQRSRGTDRPADNAVVPE